MKKKTEAVSKVTVPNDVYGEYGIVGVIVTAHAEKLNEVISWINNHKCRS